jgi:hypothetical protein
LQFEFRAVEPSLGGLGGASVARHGVHDVHRAHYLWISASIQGVLAGRIPTLCISVCAAIACAAGFPSAMLSPLCYLLSKHIRNTSLTAVMVCRQTLPSLVSESRQGWRSHTLRQGPSLHLNHPRHIPTAYGAPPHQQQVTAFDYPRKVGDGDFVPAFAAPDVGKQ